MQSMGRKQYVETMFAYVNTLQYLVSEWNSRKSEVISKMKYNADI